MTDNARRYRPYFPRSPFGLSLSGVLALCTGCASPQWNAEPVYFPPPPSPPHVVHLKSFNSLDAVVPPRPTLGELFGGQPIRPFVETPAGIAYHHGHLYICDTGLRTVHDWNLTTGRATRLGTCGDKALVTPVAVVVDPRGTIYVADTGRGEVISFDNTGVTQAALKSPGRDPYRPVALAVAGEELFVADLTGLQIDVFSTADGHHLRGITTTLVGGDIPFFPMGVAVDAAGRAYVADMMRGQVLVFSPDGKLVQTIAQRGDRYGDMGQPRHLAVGQDGILFVADAEFAHVHLFNNDGQLLMLLGGPQDRPGGTPMPIGVAIAPTLPDRLASLVPPDFNARYFIFVTNGIGNRRTSLFAIGERR
jgi:DNA-binding beta-propeller fold protein YncE